MNTQDWFPLGWTGWISLQSKGLSRVFSNTTVQKHQFFGTQLSSLSNSHIHMWPLEKTIALTRWTFVGKVMSLFFNMLSWYEELTYLKRPWCWKDWRQEEKGTTEDEMIGWHHQLDGHEVEQAPGVGDGQGSLACCSPWGCKELDTTEWLNWWLMIPGRYFWCWASWNCLHSI